MGRLFPSIKHPGVRPAPAGGGLPVVTSPHTPLSLPGSWRKAARPAPLPAQGSVCTRREPRSA